MISAGNISNRCTGCRIQILSFYDAVLQPQHRAGSRLFPRSSARPASVLSAAAGARLQQPSAARQFSTTMPAHKSSKNRSKNKKARAEAQANELSAETAPELSSAEQKAVDIETIVRQARQTFGHTLPPDYLTPEEYQIYERLYGPPLRETKPDDVGLPHFTEVDESYSSSTNTLFRETEDGRLEEVEYSDERRSAGEQVATDEHGGLENAQPLTGAQIDYLNVTANNEREYAALMKLQRDFQAASLQPLKDVNEDDMIEQDEPREEEEIDEDDGEPDAVFEDEGRRNDRVHPHTVTGQFKTHPTTLHFHKQDFIDPITALLRRTDPTHVREAAEKSFGGRGLPFSVATPPGSNSLPQKAIQMQARSHKLSEIDADAYIATILPGMYASVTSTLVETRKRLGSEWLRGLLTKPDGKGPRVLDVGSGGAGLAAWQDVVQAEWDILHDSGKVEGRKPHSKNTVIVGSDTLRHRVSRFLDNTTFMPRLPDYLHSVEGSERQLDSGGAPAPRKTFDVIIASHAFMPLAQQHERNELLDNLWAMLSPEGGVLIVLEKGHPRGFEAVADVRARLLNEFIIPPRSESAPEEILAPSERKREPGMILAPCTNHKACPMYHAPGLSAGRKDFCHFKQRFIRPLFLQKVHGVSHHNHEDIKFSYISVRRGVSADHTGSLINDAPLLQGKEAADRAFAGYENGAAPNPLALPRNVLPPLKRHGHVQLDLCTPAGTLERWIVPRSFSAQAYHDARKAQWGDLWALGAKTRTPRNVRLGNAGQVEGSVGVVTAIKNDGGVRAQAAAASGKRKKLKVVELSVDPQRGMMAAHEKYDRGKIPAERRTKGGKKVRINDLLVEAGIDRMQDPDDREDADFMRGR
ncbi:mitochondrial small ribosomal subunit Rsm22-domain-containing protein [Podospora didyma]|uniref:Mitochondrial small ribosomal subunit Rsm22-domain-containing protein n=1 Tax=Podospora didyma TaxID=330526 RepID=A0AAE0K905_9PEZI|nr:mitochondrial small ribosomal subunit Rsm22-domain-containing protein [Podospora didyma]